MPSPRSHRLATFVLASLLSCITVTASAAPPSSDKLLTGNFYQIELIVFMRTNVTEANTSEQLTALEDGRLPAAVASFASVDGERGYPFELEPKTRRMLQQTSRLLGQGLPLPNAELLVSQVPGELAVANAIAAQSSGAQGAGVIERSEQALADTELAVDPELALTEAIATFEQQLTDSSFAFRSDGLAQLSEVAARLNRSRGYRLLHTGAWHQHVPDRKQALPLLIQTGERTDDAFQLEGTISIGLGRYLHVGADFWYYEPELGAYSEVISETSNANVPAPALSEPGNAVEPPAATADSVLSYRTVVPPGNYRMHLSEKRRMRSAELHYLDHPKLGILVRIDPVPLSEAVIAAYQAAREG